MLLALSPWRGVGLFEFDDAPLPPWLWPRAAYVHVPFCAHHCGYCDFAVVTGQDHRGDEYLDALAAEVARLEVPRPVATIFLGGGTPTHLSADQLDRLLRLLTRWLPLEAGGEFSVEANPDSIDDAKLDVLSGHGVNRVSLGVQSFQPHLLRVLERSHDPDSVPVAVERVRRRGLGLSLDLIFGVPGQTLDEWRSDLRRALELQTDHVSTYGLTYEKGTRLWKQRRRGVVLALDEEIERAMYAEAMDVLTAAGLEHYEISNFAFLGHRSRHNQTYWANEAYFGFGLGAARYVMGRRELNVRDLSAYLEAARTGASVTQQSEALPAGERARETMAVQLRRCEGIDRPAFREQTGDELDRVAGASLPHVVELGLLSDDGRSVRLTREGKFVADAVIERLL
jgi:oxygen-independent coproporphyrinogen-3 oxidase